MRRPKVWILLLWLVSRLIPVGAFAAWVVLVPYDLRKLEPEASIRILDRHGCLIDELVGSDGTRCRWVRIEELPPFVSAAFVAAEDRRFYDHPGVDLRAVLRAVGDHVRGRGSGASTITMQVVRLVEPRPRTLGAKIRESIAAVRLERARSKKEILEQYLNRAPFGNRVTGIEAAALLYFGKPARDLSLAEASLLAALPQSPSRLNPFRSHRARTRQRRILDVMLKKGRITREEHARAIREPLALQRSPRTRLARYLPRRGGRTTLDRELQEEVEGIVRAHVRSLSRHHVTEGAAVVLDNRTGEVLVMVGGIGDSWVNGAAARRGPGSTVKPFTYALAFERGWSAESLLRDEPVHFETPTGDYSPRNYDRRFRGIVSARLALAGSLNIPAVRLLHAVGPAALYDALRRMDWPLEQGVEHYGLGLTLGDGETTLLALAASFATLARGGEWIRPRFSADDPLLRRKIFSSGAAETVRDLLSDDAARTAGFGRGSVLELPFPAFVKTGTSPDFRDNWTVGGTDRHTVGVWVGNLDGSPMRRVSGISGAGPIWRDIMLVLGPTRPTERIAVVRSFGRASYVLRLPTGPDVGHRTEDAERAFDVVHPNDWDSFYLDPSRPSDFQQLVPRATAPATWFVDGVRIDGTWRLRAGVHELVAVDRRGIRVRRRVRVHAFQ